MVEIVTAGLVVHGQDLVWNLKNVYVSDDQSTLNPIIYTVLICSIIAFYIYIYIIYIIYICTRICLLKLQEKLGNGFERFDALDSLGKSSFVLGSELWEEHFDSLLPLVKEYVVDVWEARKIKLYGDDTSQSQSSTGDLGEFTGIVGQSGKNMCQGGKPDTGKFHSSYVGMNVCGSAYENGCVVDGTCATAAD